MGPTPSYTGVIPDPEEKQLTTVDHAKVFVSLIGSGFAAGTSLGSVYHFLKGSYLSNGFQSRLAMARARAPRVGGMWAGVCMLCYFAAYPLVYGIPMYKGRFYPYMPVPVFLCFSVPIGFMNMARSRGPCASLRSAIIAGSLAALPDIYMINRELRNSYKWQP